MTPVNDPLSMFSARLNLLQYRYTFLEFVLSKHLKRLDALSEVIMEDKVESKSVDDTNTVEQNSTDNNAPAGDEGGEKDAAPGFMGKMKDFYDKADSMAASNALLLNKELEDRGVVEKITDETGLKVIGKDAASKLQEKKEE
jgi:hypothetical protein